MYVVRTRRIFITNLDLPPENDTSYNIIKGRANGKERIHTGTNNQDDLVTTSASSTVYSIREVQQYLGQEESRLRSIRSEVDPTQLEELKQTRDLLNFWEGQCKYLDYNLEDDDGRMVRIAETPHKTVLGLLELDDKGVSTAFQFPGTRRELLDRLRVKVIVFTDRVEVKALFPIAPICSQMCTSS